MKIISPEEIDQLVTSELAKLNERNRIDLGITRPTTWLGELDPRVVAYAQIASCEEQVKAQREEIATLVLCAMNSTSTCMTRQEISKHWADQIIDTILKRE